MTDPIETLAERVLRECTTLRYSGFAYVVLEHDVKAATALLRAHIEAERAAAVEAFERVVAAARALAEWDWNECGSHEDEFIAAGKALDQAMAALTSAPSADELVRRVRAPLLKALRECHALLGRSTPFRWEKLEENESSREKTRAWAADALGLREKIERLLPPAKEPTDG